MASWQPQFKVLGHWTYLALELGWAAPVITIQWLAGPRSLWASRRILALAAGLPAVYLSLADAFAIANGIWSIDPRRTVAVGFGSLPLEEALFFLLTNVMVVQAIILLGSKEPRQRLRWLFAHGS